MGCRGLALVGILLAAENLLRRLTGDSFPQGGFTVLEFGDQVVTHGTPHELAAKLYRRLGAKRYVSVDGNGRGSITFDLNRPTNELVGKLHKFDRAGFDLVTDFGTGEHIFDQAQFWRTVHALTKPGGFIIFDRPSQGYDAHCFWRTDLSTYRDIAAANDYAVIELEAHAGRNGGELVIGVMQKTKAAKFRVPQQGRYQKLLRPIIQGRQ